MCEAHSPAGRSSEKLSDQASRPPGSVDFDWRVVGLAVELLGDRGGDLAGSVVLVAHASAGPVLLEAVADVEVLFEVVAEGEVEEGPTVGGELHGRGETALDDCNVARGKMAVQLVHVGVPDLGLFRDMPTTLYVPTAAIVVEIVSRNDDTWDKFALGGRLPRRIPSVKEASPMRAASGRSLDRRGRR